MSTDVESPVLILVGAAQLAACTGPPRAERDVDPAAAQEAAVAVADGRVLAVAPKAELLRRYPHADRFDCDGGLITPGLVDSHTHAVFGRWRADEYVLRSGGVPYMEIARRGGGINASVRDLRERSEDELVELSLPRSARCFATG